MKPTFIDDILERIREVDGQLVMMDEDLADLYGVAPAELRTVVRLNEAIFTADFVVPLAVDGNRKGRLAFTEHGVIVAASMLGAPGIEALSIHVVRAFVKLREATVSHPDVARRVELLSEAVTALDARICREFIAIYEALGMSVSTAESASPTGQRLH